MCIEHEHAPTELLSNFKTWLSEDGCGGGANCIDCLNGPARGSVAIFSFVEWGFTLHVVVAYIYHAGGRYPMVETANLGYRAKQLFFQVNGKVNCCVTGTPLLSEWFLVLGIH